MFCGENRGGSEARMGGFAAEFRGFWVARGRGAAIQCTADSAGTIGQKNFKKGAEKGGKLKNWGARGAEKWRRGTLYRACGAIFGSRIF